jgi:peptidoglycan/xylan/chitin deacetylase (PgdA/CDA1 family)
MFLPSFRAARVCGLLAALCCVPFPGGAAVPRAQALPAGPGVPVFTYHRVDRDLPADQIGQALTITPQQFAEQLATLEALRIHTISAAELVTDLRRGTVPSRTVVLTFDDGYKDAITQALPILQRFHETATFYINSSSIGTPRHLTWADVRTLRDAGMEIGSHGAEHVDLRELAAQGQASQASRCVAAIERWAGVEPVTYAYPSGRYNATTFAVMRRERVQAAFTMEPGFVRDLTEPYRLPRIRVVRWTAVEQFRAIAANL